MIDQAFNSSTSTRQHREHDPEQVGFAVLTVSDSRTKNDDSSGQLICEHLGFRGHSRIGYVIVPEKDEQIQSQLNTWLADPEIDAIIVNGGTDLGGRDVIIPTIASLIEQQIPGFGELFRMLSWEEIGSASMLSRAIAGVHGRTVIFSIPGSTNEVRLALGKLIGPELGHIVHKINQESLRSNTWHK